MSGWVDGGWALPACLPWLQNEGTPQCGSLTEGPSIPSPPASPCPLSPWPQFCSPALLCLPSRPSESLWAWVWRLHRKFLLPTPPLPSPSSHIKLAISVSATLWPEAGEGLERQDLSVSLVCVCLQFLVRVLSMPCASACSIANSERGPCMG